MLSYKGYCGKVSFDDEAEIFHGEVCGLRDVVTFQATAADEVKREFRESIDDYLDVCRESGQQPDKPFSGKFIVRIPPELHRDLHNRASVMEISLNSLVVSLLEDAQES
jgi:predicted HicB family RNase H-like nuclease